MTYFLAATLLATLVAALALEWGFRRIRRDLKALRESLIANPPDHHPHRELRAAPAHD